MQRRDAAVPKDTDLLPGRCPIEGQLECKIFVHEATIWISRPEYVVSGPGSSLKKTPPSRLKSTLPLQKSPFLRFLVNLRKTGSIYKEQKTRKPPFSPLFLHLPSPDTPKLHLSLLGTREGDDKFEKVRKVRERPRMIINHLRISF